MPKNRGMLAELEATAKGRPAVLPRVPAEIRSIPEAPASVSAPKKRAERSGTGSSNPSRKGLVNVTGYFPPAVKQSIKLIQAHSPSRITEQALLGEALNDLFAKYKVPQVALEASASEETE